MSIKWYEILDIAILIQMGICVADYISLFLNTELPTLPVQESGFDKFVASAERFDVMIIRVSFLFISLSLRNLRLLTTQFPSFGALFETVNIAKRDLANIFICAFVISFGFIYSSTLMLGPYIDSAMSIWDSCNKVLKTMLGEEAEQNYINSSIPKSLSDIIFISIVLVFILILLKITVSIVIIRYKYLREKTQLDNEAKARIIHQDSLKYRQKWTRLLFFKKPEGATIIERQNSGRNVENTLNTEFTIWMTFRLNLKNLRAGLPIKTKEEREAELREMKQKIIKEKLQNQKDRINKYKPENFHKIKKSFIFLLVYLVYWILFILIVSWQINIQDNFEQSRVSDILKDEIVESSMSAQRVKNVTGRAPPPSLIQFDSIVDTPEVFDWSTHIIDNFLVDINATINHHNYLFGDPRIRMSVRKAKNYDNPNPRTSEAIPYVISNNKYNINDNLGSEENTTTLSINGMDIVHTPSGSRDSPRELGGYVYTIQAGAEDVGDLMTDVYFSDLITPAWVFIIIEFVYYNANYDVIVENDIIFYKSAAGITSQRFSTSIIQDYYKSGKDYFRAFLEIIFILMFLYYL